MINGTCAELVVTSFDDPIVTTLLAERAADGAARSGAAAGDPAPAEPGTVFLVARDRGGPLGCAALRWIGADAAQVSRLYVRARDGAAVLARALLATAEDLARDRGCRVARARVRGPREAEPYEANGYVRVPAPARRRYPPISPAPPVPAADAAAGGACLEKALHVPPRR